MGICAADETHRRFLERAFERLGLAADLRRLLLAPFRETRVSIPLKLRWDGRETVRVYTGFRVQHNHARGPFRGACASTRPPPWPRPAPWPA